MILTIVGFIGVGMILLSYYMIQSGKWRAEDARYCWVNITGSVGVLISLIEAFNWPSLVIQVAWITITLYGMGKRALIARQSK